MRNIFENAMSKWTDEDLIKIVNSQSGEYQPEAIKLTEQEIEKRYLTKEKTLKYSDIQILDIINFRKEHLPYEVIAAEAEAKNRNLNFKNEEVQKEADINKEIQKLNALLVKINTNIKDFSSFKNTVMFILFLILTSLIFFYAKEGLLGNDISRSIYKLYAK